jgi:Zinc carboxypeptidase
MRLSRRELLKLGAGALGACAAHPSAGERLSLPLADDLRAEVMVARAGLQKLAQIDRLGRSRGGRPIDLISVGRGTQSALVVGAPHPNEPIGCLTIVRMLERLAADRQLRDRAGYRWHFIPAIDIDGIALNQAWFRSLTLETYLHDFYRPSFDRQPEYTFPLELPEYRFDASTPENICWQQALELSRPDLQCSLHGADSGGAFYIVSEDLPGLDRLLAALPDQHGIDLNPAGEPFADMRTFRPGVCSFPAISATIERSRAAGADPKETWNAGDSSASYAGSRYGTFSMTCEVPLWDDARTRNPEPSPLTMVDVIDAQIQQAREDESALAAALPLLRDRASSFEASALLASLEAALRETQAAPASLEPLKASQDGRTKLSYRDLVQYEAGAAGLRTPAMLVRLARLVDTPAAASDADRILHRRLAARLQAGPLRPLSLSSTSSLHIDSIVTTAGFLRT